MFEDREAAWVNTGAAFDGKDCCLSSGAGLLRDGGKNLGVLSLVCSLLG